MNIIKQDKTNWKYIGITVILGLITTGAIFIYQKDMIHEMTTLLRFSEIKKSEEVFTSQQVILSNEEVSEILGIPGKRLEYSEGPFYHPWTEEKHKIAIDINNLLVDAFQFKNEEIKKRLEKVKKEVIKWGEVLEDAPDSRAYFGVYVKLCITESIIYNDLKNTIQHCGYKKDFSFNKENVDDLTADSQVLPFFINGYAYYYEGNHSEADYYFNKVKLHHQLLKSLEYVDLNSEYFERYNKIYNKILEVSPEKEGYPFLPSEVITNLEFQKYIEVALEANPELKLEEFAYARTRGIKSLGYMEGYEYLQPSPPDPRWIFSPDGTKALLTSISVLDAESELIIYNRNGEEKREWLGDCGPGCGWLIAFWLDNTQFITIFSSEHLLPEEDCIASIPCYRYICEIQLYDLSKNTVISYSSPKLKAHPKNPWFIEQCKYELGEESELCE